MRYRCWTLTIIPIVLGLARPVMAQAQFVCPEASTPEQARRLAGEVFAEAEARYQAADFRAAIDRFECSYSLVPHPATLFNISRTAEDLNDLPLALLTYRSFLERFVDAERRREVEARVRVLEEQVAPEDVPPVGDSVGTDDGPTDDRGTGELGGSPPDDGAQPSVELRMSTPRLLAWIFLGLGLATGGAGGGLMGAAFQRSDDYRAAETRGEPQSVLGDLVSEGQNLETAGWIMIGAGGAMFITSLVLFFAFEARAPVEGEVDQQAHLWPVFAPGVIGFGGTFE